jgi:transcriptional regulator with XRE-family HTH domain
MPLDARHVARALRDHRRAAGMTQSELAERAGLAFETVSRLESGREPPSLRSIVAMAEALGTSLDAIVTPGDEPPKVASNDLPIEMRRLISASRDLEPRLIRHLTAVASAMRRGPAPGKRRKART